MYITKQLLGQDPTLRIYKEGNWKDPVTTDQVGYTSFNDAGIECETGEFLFAWMRILKPKHVLETGTHWGVGASYMGAGLRDNGEGHLDTIEFLPEIHNQAKARIERLGLQSYVTCHYGDVAKFQPTVKYDFILLDTEPQTRFGEFIQFYDSLNEGGYLFIHDLHQHMHQIPNEEHGFAWPYGKVPDFMLNVIRTGKVRPFHFHTPRGLTGFYKTHPEDYKFMVNSTP